MRNYQCKNAVIPATPGSRLKISIAMMETKTDSKVIVRSAVERRLMRSMLKTERVKSNRHLKFLSTLPCVITGATDRVQACHIRSGNAGMGIKSPDNFAVPMNHLVHIKQHAMGSEHKFWEPYGGIEKAKELANALWVRTGQYDECLKLIARFRKGFR